MYSKSIHISFLLSSCRIALIAGTFYGLPAIQFVLGQQLVCIRIFASCELSFVVRVFLIMAIKISVTTILSVFIHGE